jgi:uncharacterized membrane protein
MECRLPGEEFTRAFLFGEHGGQLISHCMRIAEFWAVRPGLSGAMVARIASIDLWYGILATAVLVLGFCGDIQRIRRYLQLELALFMLLPIFAAAMARGYGEF